MITQRIRQWFAKAFSWWPWKRPVETYYVDSVGVAKHDTAHEWHSRPTFDGFAAQPGITTRRSTLEEWSDPLVQAQPTAFLTSPDEGSDALFSPPDTQESVPVLEVGSAPNLEAGTTPPAEQHLAFLRYLVQRGIINEGFSSDELPDQYKN